MSATAAQVIQDILASRGPDKTLCPSEAARALAGPDGDWRARMGEVHEAADALLAASAVALSWQGERLQRRDGPYRIGGTPA